MRKILILEDNQYSAESLKHIIKEAGHTLEVYLFQSAEEAYEFSVKEVMELFIVDIKLSHIKADDASGMEFVEQIRKINIYKFSPVIFITACPDYKFDAYDYLHCYRFLEKPFTANEFSTVFHDALEMAERYDKEKYVCFKDRYTITNIKIRNIVYIECKNKKLVITTITGKISFYYRSISEVRNMITDDMLFQCNRSTLVNRKYIEKIDMKKKTIQLKENYGILSFGRVFKKRIKEEFAG